MRWYSNVFLSIAFLMFGFIMWLLWWPHRDDIRVEEEYEVVIEILRHPDADKYPNIDLRLEPRVTIRRVK